MVCNLNCGLSADAKFALTDRVGGIAFEFLGEAHLDRPRLPIPNDLGFALHYTNENSATCRAEWTDSRLPSGNSRQNFFFGDKADQLVFRIAATCKGRACAAGGGPFNELAAVHLISISVMA